VSEDPVDSQFRRFQRHRDPAALAAVFDATAPRLLLVAMHLCRDAATAEDLVQTVFLQAIADAESFDPNRPVLPWLLGILEHRAIDLRRRTQRRREAEHAASDQFRQHREASPLASAAGSELREQLAAALVRMPGEYRHALTLRLVHGLRAVEIAHAEGTSPTTVRSRLHRGLQMLRAVLPRSLGSGGLLALLTSELLQARDGLATMRGKILAAAAASAPAAWSGKFAALAAMLLAVLGAFSLWPEVSDELAVADPPAASVGRADATVPRNDEPTASLSTDLQRTAVAPEGANQAATTSMLRGRVVDARSRQPLPGTEVQFRSYLDREPGTPDYDYQVPEALTTAADGSFAVRFAPSSSRALELQFQGNRHVVAWRTVPPMRGGVEFDLGDVVLVPGTPVRLRTTLDGQPAGGLLVWTAQSVDGQKPKVRGENPRSNREGFVDCGILAPGRWYFEVDGPFADNQGWFDVELQPDPLEVPVPLAMPTHHHSLSGRLVDPRGEALAGVELALMARSGAFVATTLLDGRFAMRIQPQNLAEPPRLRLWQDHSPYELLDDGGDATPGRHDLQLVARLRTTASLQVEVVTAGTGTPVERFFVDWRRRLPGRAGAPSLHPGGRTGPIELLPGPWFVSVFPVPPFCEQADLAVVLREGERHTLRVEVAEPASLAVYARTSDGSPAGGVELELAKVVPADLTSRVDAKRWRLRHANARAGLGGGTPPVVLVMAQATTDANGRATLQAPPNLEGLLVFSGGPRHANEVHRGIVLPQHGSRVDLTVVAAGEVHGRLEPAELVRRLSPASERVAAEATQHTWFLPRPSELDDEYPRIELRSTADDRRRFASHTAADGTFTIGGVPAGEYAVWLIGRVSDAKGTGLWSHADGPLTHWAVRDGRNPPRTLDARHLVPGQARLQCFVDGTPWPGKVHLWALPPADGMRVLLERQPDGWFASPWLRPGRYLAAAEGYDEAGEPERSFCTATITVPPGGTATATVPIVRSRLELRLETATGQPLANRWVRVETPDLPIETWWHRRQLDGDGRLRLEPRPPGRVRILLWPASADPDAEPTLVGELAPDATHQTLRLR
jgi:RNA polymerase sigma-70 factor (ECF subfamily)